MAVPREVHDQNKINALDRQPGLKASIDSKSFSGAVANPAVRKERSRPPDPEKRSPGAGGTAAGADRKSNRKSSRKINTEPRRPVQVPDRDLAVYDGRIKLANISGTDNKFLVVLPSAIVLGSFRSLKLALAAVTAAHGGAR